MDERDGVTPTTCPRCGCKLDASTCVERPDVLPKPGDFSVCLRCGQILRFDDSLKPVSAHSWDLATLPAETRGLLAKMSIIAPIVWRQHRSPS